MTDNNNYYVISLNAPNEIHIKDYRWVGDHRNPQINHLSLRYGWTWSL